MIRRLLLRWRNRPDPALEKLQAKFGSHYTTDRTYDYAKAVAGRKRWLAHSTAIAMQADLRSQPTTADKISRADVRAFRRGA